MRILVAEDSPTVRRLVCTRLLADGYEVIEGVPGTDVEIGGANPVLEP